MAFDKLIIRGVVGAAKSGIKMDLALDSLKQKVLDQTVNNIESNIPLPLPFNMADVLLGTQPLDPNLISVDYISNLPPQTLEKAQTLSPTQRTQILDTLDTLESTVNSVIQQKNSLQGALGTITQPLNTLETTANTIQGVTTGIKAAVTIIKNIPIPTSVPPGVGVPINVINRFSNSLDTLKTVIDKFEGPLKIIPPSIIKINDILIPLVGKLAEFDSIFQKILNIIAFIRLLLKYPNITQSDIGQIQQDMAISLQQSLALSGISTSNNLLNTAGDKDLLDQLDPNSNNPLIYKEFRLIIEFDPSNTFKFPARRIKAENSKGVKLYSTPPDQGSGEVNTSSTYSFSSSTNVLIDEVKFNIDQYLKQYPTTKQSQSPNDRESLVAEDYPSTSPSGTSGSSALPKNTDLIPFGVPGTISGEVRFRSGKAWRWLGGSSNKWVAHTVSFLPFTEKGINDEERFIRENAPSPTPRAYYKWNETLYKWEFQRRVYNPV